MCWVILTNAVWYYLQLLHTAIFQKLDAIDAVYSLILDQVEGRKDGDLVQHDAFPAGDLPRGIPPAMLDLAADQALQGVNNRTWPAGGQALHGVNNRTWPAGTLVMPKE